MSYVVIMLIVISMTVLFALSLLCLQIYLTRHRIMEKKALEEKRYLASKQQIDDNRAKFEAQAKLKNPQWEQPKSDPKTAGLDGPIQASKDVVQSDFDAFLLKHNELSIRFDKLEKQLRVPQKEVDNDILRTITNDYVKSIEDDLNTLFSPPRPPVSKEFLADFGIHKEDLLPPKHDSDCPICLSIEKVRNRKNLHIRQPKTSWH